MAATVEVVAHKAVAVKVVGYPMGGAVKATAAAGQVGQVIHPVGGAAMPPLGVGKSKLDPDLA